MEEKRGTLEGGEREDNKKRGGKREGGRGEREYERKCNESERRGGG